MQPGNVGVDFGTATTLVAERVSWGLASVVPLGRSTNWLPSVARAERGALVVGEAADEVGDGAGADRVIRSIKRTITERRHRITVADVDGPYDVDADGVIAAILTELADRARRAGVHIDSGREVRLGCPAMWDGAQRRRLIDIAVAAGLPVADAALVDEPVAAGVAWLAHRYLQHGERPTGRLLVFDMGGGTLDVAVLSVAGGPRPEISVLACIGMAMAGDALDAAIARDLAAEMARNRIDVAMHPQPELAWALLQRAAREAKIRLSRAEEHPVVLPRQLAYPHVLRYRRELLEDAFRTQMDGAENLVFTALRAARVTWTSLGPAELRAIGRDELVADIDFVLLVGGMSRIPYVARRLGSLFPDAHVYDSAGVPPEEAVVAGLTDPVGYERINLHRPGFDFVVEWDLGRERRTLYEAHTPLYEPWQIYNGRSDLGYERRLRPPDVPAHGDGCLRVLSASGRPLRLQLDGRPLRGLPMRFGPDEIVFRVFCDGRVTLVDGAGQETAVRADTWPIMGRSIDGLALRGVDNS